MKYVKEEIIDESGTRIGDFLVPVDDIEDAEEFQENWVKQTAEYHCKKPSTISIDFD